MEDLMKKITCGRLHSFINHIFLKSKSEKGQTLVEYGLLLVLIAVVVIAAVTTVGKKANNYIRSRD
jgi:Flp pilus assembly pilin Flp